MASYILEDSSKEDHYKLGHTRDKKTFKKRLKDLQTGNIYLSPIFYSNSIDEQTLKDVFQHYHLKKEHYKIPKKILTNFIKNNSKNMINYSDKNFHHSNLEEAHVTKIMVTPEMAEEMLIGNNVPSMGIKNRTANKNIIREYVQLMDIGDWKNWSSLLIFGLNKVEGTRYGDLQDGQKRLMAVIKSGKSIGFCVLFNQEHATKSICDTQQKRSASNVLAMNYDIKYATSTAAAIQLLNCFDRKDYNGNKTIKNNLEILRYYEKNKDNIEKSKVNVNKYTNAFPPLSMGMVIFLNMIFETYNPDNIVSREFMDSLCYGTNLSRNNCLTSVRTRLLKSHSNKQERLSKYYMFYLIFSAYNNYVTGNKNKKIKYSKIAEFPINVNWREYIGV